MNEQEYHRKMRFWSALGFWVCVLGIATLVVIFIITGCTPHGCVR